MKKAFCFLLVIGLVLFLGSCNTSGDDSKGPNGPDGPEGPGDVDITDGGLYVFGSSDSYPGVEIDLKAKLAEGESFADISKYASVTVDAVLYSDEEGETVAVNTANDNLAQFKLLKASGNWDDASNICGDTKYNMVVNGATTWTVPNGASGVPAILLVQANWVDFPGAVKSIKINKYTFTPKTSDVVLDNVFGASYVSVSGNKITFINAEYKDGAAQYEFSNSFFPLAGKKLVFAFKLEGFDDTLEHQIHIQAAQADTAKDKFNGRDTQPGQKYVTLDDDGGQYDQSYDSATATGVFKIPLDGLLAAAEVSGNANDIKGPFELNAVRIANNGTVWPDPGTGITHSRDKSYTLIFESITVE
jgi:hypothetical protein